MGPNALPMFDIDMDTQSSHWFIFPRIARLGEIFDKDPISGETEFNRRSQFHSLTEDFYPLL